MTDGTTPSRETVAHVEKVTPGSGDAATYATGQAARELGVSSSAVRKMIASGELVAHRDERGRYLIPQDTVRAKLEERGGADSPLKDRAGLSRVTEEVGKSRDDLLREEVAATRRQLRQLTEEVGALRGELGPLARLARSAEEDKKRVLEEKVALAEERARLVIELEQERHRVAELAAEMEAMRQTWWAQWLESRSRESQGA